MLTFHITTQLLINNLQYSVNFDINTFVSILAFSIIQIRKSGVHYALVYNVYFRITLKAAFKNFTNSDTAALKGNKG